MYDFLTTLGKESKVYIVEVKTNFTLVSRENKSRHEIGVMLICVVFYVERVIV